MTISVRLFPQSFVQLTSPQAVVYIDPSITNSMGDVIRSMLPWPKGRSVPEGMPAGDLILASHHHADHLDNGMILQLRGESTKAVGPAKCIKKLGPGATVVKAGDSVSHHDVVVRAVEAYNPSGSRGMIYHRKGECIGFVIEVDGRRIYHAGDTGLIEEMDSLGAIDLAFLPIGGKFTMDIDEAVEAVKRIRPTLVIPMHLMQADPEEFKKKVENETTSNVTVLSPARLWVSDAHS